MWELLRTLKKAYGAAYYNRGYIEAMKDNGLADNDAVIEASDKLLAAQMELEMHLLKMEDLYDAEEGA